MRTLEDLEIYQLSMKIGEVIWVEIMKWEYFPKSTIGTQLIRSVDSVSANIAEGYGRNSSKEVKQYCFYSRGSLKETICFLQKSRNRNLIDDVIYTNLMNDIEILGKKLNSYIKYLS